MKVWIVITISAATCYLVACERVVSPISNNVAWQWRIDSIGVAPTTLEGIWGSSSTDIYATGYGYSYPGQRASGVWHYNGIKWEETNLPLVNNTRPFWYGIWGIDANNIWLVGSLTGDTFINSNNGSVVLYWNGVDWLPSLLLEDGPVLKRVWASSPLDVFVVGYNGFIYHYDGQQWSRHDAGVSKNLSDVWGISSTDVYVGLWYDNNILHYNGETWSLINLPPPPQSDHIIAALVWGNSSQNVYLSGNAGSNVRAIPSGFGFLYKGHLSEWENKSDLVVSVGSVSSIYGESDETIYLTTYDGILQIDHGKAHLLGTFPYLSLIKVWVAFERVFAVGTTRRTDGTNVGIILQGFK